MGCVWGRGGVCTCPVASPAVCEVGMANRPFSAMMSWGKSRHLMEKMMHVLYMKHENTNVFMYFLHLVPTHYIVVEKGLFCVHRFLMFPGA